MKKKLFATLLLLLLLCTVTVSVVLGQEPEPEPSMAEKLKLLLQTMFQFIGAALIWALTGFFKVRDPNEEGFDPVQFFITLIVGAVTGLIAFVIFETTGYSLAPEQIWQYLVAAGFVAFVESWIKVIWRRVGPYFTPPTPAAKT